MIYFHLLSPHLVIYLHGVDLHLNVRWTLNAVFCCGSNLFFICQLGNDIVDRKYITTLQVSKIIKSLSTPSSKYLEIYLAELNLFLCLTIECLWGQWKLVNAFGILPMWVQDSSNRIIQTCKPTYTVISRELLKLVK
jgi:hypothetical protein